VSKVLGLEITTRKLVLRIIGAIIAFLAYFFIFSYMPSNPNTFMRLFGLDFDLQSFFRINPYIPIIGLGIAASLALGVLLRRAKGEGLANIAGGALIAVYIYLLLDGGVIKIRIPEGLAQGLSADVTLDLITLMYLFLIPPLLTIVKGLLQLIKR